MLRATSASHTASNQQLTRLRASNCLNNKWTAYEWCDSALIAATPTVFELQDNWSRR